MPPSITLYNAEVADALAAASWSTLPSLRRLLHGSVSTTLGYDAGPDPSTPLWAFLAADVGQSYTGALRALRRFFVLLPKRALLTLDIAEAAAPPAWNLAPASGTSLVRHSILPKPGDSPDAGPYLFFNVLAVPGQAVEPILSVDLAGARLGSTVVMFHSDRGMARSAVFFDLEAPGKLDFLVAGLAPGGWDIWKDGFLEDSGGLVRPQAGTLSFSGEAGNYYLRHR